MEGGLDQPASRPDRPQAACVSGRTAEYATNQVAPSTRLPQTRTSHAFEPGWKPFIMRCQILGAQADRAAAGPDLGCLARLAGGTPPG